MAKGRWITKQQNHNIQEMLKLGVQVKVIASRLGLSKTVIATRAKRMRDKGQLPSLDTKSIQTSLWLSHRALDHLAAKAGAAGMTRPQYIRNLIEKDMADDLHREPVLRPRPGDDGTAILCGDGLRRVVRDPR